MKKCIFILMVALLICSCDMNSYEVGSIGPSGGIIIYNCDSDNRDGNPDGLKSKECGWKYLEASYVDLTVGETEKFIFGQYMENSLTFFVNGTTTYVEGTGSATDGKCTGTKIGTGQANTTKLINKMGAAAHTVPTETTSYYAALLCSEFTYGGYDDWFLPSKDELDKLLSVLRSRGIGNLSDEGYWSSSEYGENECYAHYQYFRASGSGMKGTAGRSTKLRIRPIRAFI